MLRNSHTRFRACLRSAACASVAFGALAVSMTGCSYDPNNVSFDYITKNLTPEMQGLSERDVDIDRNLAVNQDQTLRMFWGDLGRATLFDQPSMLSPFYIISTNGQPR